MLPSNSGAPRPTVTHYGRQISEQFRTDLGSVTRARLGERVPPGMLHDLVVRAVHAPVRVHIEPEVVRRGLLPAGRADGRGVSEIHHAVAINVADQLAVIRG